MRMAGNVVAELPTATARFPPVAFEVLGKTHLLVKVVLVHLAPVLVDHVHTIDDFIRSIHRGLLPGLIADQHRTAVRETTPVIEVLPRGAPCRVNRMHGLYMVRIDRAGTQQPVEHMRAAPRRPEQIIAYKVNVASRNRVYRSTQFLHPPGTCGKPGLVSPTTPPVQSLANALSVNSERNTSSRQGCESA